MDAILSGLSVLVIDDDADAREMLEQALSTRGANVRAVDSADGARCVLATHTPDVIVSDIEMPHEDGVTFIRNLRGLSDAAKASIPAVALSALAGSNVRDDAVSSGFTVYLAKPAELWVLAELICDMARTSSSRAEGAWALRQ